MSDLLDLMRNNQWAWRSDMNAPQPGAPELKAALPRDVTDNVRPMAYDALSSLGVDHPLAQYLSRRIGAAAPWTPPGFVVDAAGVIGGKLHEGKPVDAALSAYLLYGAGKLGQAAGNAFLPPLTDKAKAKALQAMYPDEQAPIGYQGLARYIASNPGVSRSLAQQESGGVQYFVPRRQSVEPPIANVNDRRNFNRAFNVVSP